MTTFTQPTTRIVTVDVVICPNCLNYYGSSSMPPDMAAVLRQGRVEDKKQGDPHSRLVKGTRADCPQCQTPRVHRQAQVTL